MSKRKHRSTTNAPKPSDEVLSRMIPYLREHLHSMYLDAAANGHSEFQHAAQMLDSLALDNYRMKYAKTLNQQAQPVEPRGPRRVGRPRTKLSAEERTAIRELVTKGKALARDPAVIVAVMEEQES
jgi:hypothetical protein